MCYDDNARPPFPSGTPGAAQGEDRTLTAADGTRFAAYSATPDDTPAARIVILPDVRGLHTFYKDLALRLAEQGIAAIAMDYFGRTAGLTPRDDAFEYMPHVQQLQLDAVNADVDAALSAFDDAVLPTFTLGFCMGGTFSLLTGTRDLALTGVISFYAALSREFGGSGTVLDRATSIRHPILSLFGGADQAIPVDQVEEFKRRLDTTDIPHEVAIYPGAPHGFFDRRSAEYAEASADSWQRVLSFVAAYSRPVGV